MPTITELWGGRDTYLNIGVPKVALFQIIIPTAHNLRLSWHEMGGVASLPVDPRQRPQVICVGYQRTGTLSMALALEKLGYGPVAHGGSQLVGREDGAVKSHGRKPA